MTLIDRAISHSELRALCPAHSTPFDTPPDYCQRMSIESGSDLSLSLELSSSPQKPTSSLSANSFPKLLDLSNSQLDSGISSPISQAKKKLSVVSASSLTPTTPRSLERVSVSPLTRVGSLSQMVLTVHDFVTALDGFVPVSLRGLPLHTGGTVNFSHVGGLEKTKQALRETLLWPSKVREMPFLPLPFLHCNLHPLLVPQAVQSMCYQAAMWCVAIWSSRDRQDITGWSSGQRIWTQLC